MASRKAIVRHRESLADDARLIPFGGLKIDTIPDDIAETSSIILSYRASSVRRWRGLAVRQLPEIKSFWLKQGRQVPLRQQRSSHGCDMFG